MSIANDPDPVQGATRISQIIVGALIQGVVLFMAIVLLFIDAPTGPGPARSATPILTYLAAAFGATVLAASYLVPRLMVDGALRRFVKSGAATTAKRGPRQVDPAVAAKELLPLFQTQLIVASALCEGGAFFATIAYMLEHQYLSLGVAGVLLAALISRFPTLDRVNAWLEEKLVHLQEIRRGEI